MPRASIRSLPGSGSARVRRRTGSCWAGSGVGSSSSEASSTAARPSTMQWWDLPTIARRRFARVLADPHLPERAVTTQRYRHHLVDQAVERTWRPVDVPIDREGGVVDPLGRVQAERDRRELLAVARRAADAQLDVVAQLREARQPPLGGRREQRDPAHVHVRGRRLDREEGGIERRQPWARHLAITNGAPPTGYTGACAACACARKDGAARHAGARDMPSPPFGGERELRQPLEVAVQRRGRDPAAAQRDAGATIVESDLHGEVGEEDLAAYQGAAAALVGRAAHQQRVHCAGRPPARSGAASGA